MQKRKFLAFAMILVIILAVLAGCSSKNYTLRIEGVGEQEIAITKKQLKKLTPIEFTKDEPCFSSDLRDEEGNLVPFRLKGVELRTILSQYAKNFVITESAAVSFVSNGGEKVSFASPYYNADKIIVAYEFEGKALKLSKKFTLKLVVQDTQSSYWLDDLAAISFDSGKLPPPSPSKIAFLHAFDKELPDMSTEFSAFTEDTVVGNVAYKSISLARLASVAENEIGSGVMYGHTYLQSGKKTSRAGLMPEYYLGSKLTLRNKTKNEIEAKLVVEKSDTNNLSRMNLDGVTSIYVGKYGIINLDLLLTQKTDKQPLDERQLSLATVFSSLPQSASIYNFSGFLAGETKRQGAVVLRSNSANYFIKKQGDCFALYYFDKGVEKTILQDLLDFTLSNA